MALHQVLQQAATSEIWKLHFLELLVTDWLLLPDHALHLLSTFDPELGSEEKLSAAVLFYGRLVQPMEFWEAVMPAFNGLQQAKIRHMYV